jgi:catechol 2,3-dioxygenase-like lactoylglutathione lyase family enzyme
MIDHTGLMVTDLDRSAEFFAKALAPLGYSVLMKFGPVVGLGEKKPDLWLHAGTATDKIHIALRATSRSAVKAFYEAAIAAGGTDNGPPGVRENYHPDYFAAFVRCPDGHNIEAVCHEAYLG